MIRQDKFQVGDKVFFKDEDPYIGNTTIRENHERHYGKGPYTIEEIEEVTSSFRSVMHTQFVIINGYIYSGAWFKPLR